MSKGKYSADQLLAKELSKYFADPLGYVMFAFPWDSEPSIQMVELSEPWKSKYKCKWGPDKWACEFLDEWGREIKKRGFKGQDAVDPIKFSTASGHGIGKSALCAWISKFILDTRPHSKGTITAGTDGQLRTKTWAELGKWHRMSITRNWFNWTTGRGAMALVHVKHPQWALTAQTCREENSESFAGQHAIGATSFYIFDEASQIPDKIYEVREGGTVVGEPMIFDFGNPTRKSGMFFENCLSADTNILTQFGWKRIIEVSSDDLLWDGEEWVSHEGLVYQGYRRVISVSGVLMTPEHQILTTEGWKNASEDERHTRAPCRLPDRGIPCWQSWAGVPVVSKMRLREGSPSHVERTSEKCGEKGILRLHGYRETYGARDAPPSSIWRMEGNARSVFSPLASGLEKLRGARDICLRALEGIFPKLLGGYGRGIPAWAYVGAQGQQRGILGGELPLGHARGATTQHSIDPSHTHSKGRHAAMESGRTVGVESAYSVGPQCDSTSGREDVRPAEEAVYDLLNAGPRHRFTVRAGDGTGLIVSNCIGRNRHRYIVRQIDSRSVAVTNKKLHAQWIADHGVESDFVKVRILGQFPSAGTLQFIPSDLVEAASARDTFPNPQDPLIIGVDVARFGDDDSVIYPRIGNDARSFPVRRFKKQDTVIIAGKVIDCIKEFKELGKKCAALFVDGGGVGGGVVDQLRHLGYSPVEVNFGATPNDSGTYRFKVDEMWGNMKDALAKRLAIPADRGENSSGGILKQQLTQREFGYTIAGNKINLESKADMKERLGGDYASPDVADALALTFAQEILVENDNRFGAPEPLRAQDDYDPHSYEVR